MYSTVQFHVERMLEQGYSSADLVRGTGLLVSDLRTPWPLYAPEACTALIRNLYQLSGDTALGVTINQNFSVRYMGLLGFAVLTSQTFGEARKLMIRYRALMDAAVFPSHQFEKGSWILTLHPLFPMEGEVRRFAFEGYMIKAQLFCQELTRRDDFVAGIDFNFPEPPYAGRYRDHLRCDIRFDQDACRLRYNPGLLDFPLPFASQEMHTLCLQQCELRFKQLSHQESLTSKVYQVLYRNHSLDNHSLLSLVEVASRQYISPRTLRRKLASENSSFQVIANDVRRDLALHYLRETGLSVKEISFSLGYSAVNNFHRAFREWTGSPVSAVRGGK